MATRVNQPINGPYEGWVRDIENKKVEQAARTAVERQPIAQRFTPLSPEAVAPTFARPAVGPVASPSEQMRETLMAPARIAASGSPNAPVVASPFTAPGSTLASPQFKPQASIGPTNAAVAEQKRLPVTTTAPAKTTTKPAVAIVAPTAGRDRFGRVQWTPAMDSEAAINLKRQMGVQTQAGLRGTRMGDVRNAQLESQWADAAEAALTGAMSPKQYEAYQARKAQDQFQKIQAFQATPQYQAVEQAGRTAIGVEEAKARGEIGKQGTIAEQAALERASREKIAAGKEPTDRELIAKEHERLVVSGAAPGEIDAAMESFRKHVLGQGALPTATNAPVKQYANGEKTTINGVVYVYDAKSGKLKKQ